MPLPFKLDHINLWLLEDQDGGRYRNRQRRDAGSVGKDPRKKRVTRVVLTHYHPTTPAMPRGSASATAPTLDDAGRVPDGARGAHCERRVYADAVLAVFRKNGLDEARAARMRGSRNRYAELVPDFPHSYRRIIEGDEIAIGAHRWRAIVGHGHAPEHLSLFCKSSTR